MLRSDAGCHFHDHSVQSIIVRGVGEPDMKIALLRRIGSTVCRFSALELYPAEIADDLDGSLLLPFEGRQRGPGPLGPGLLTDARGHLEIGELLKVDRLKSSRNLGTVLEPVERRISTLALHRTAVKILGQRRRRAEEQEPREDGPKKPEPLLRHDVSPVREIIKIIAWFSSLPRPRRAGVWIQSVECYHANGSRAARVANRECSRAGQSPCQPPVPL